MSSIEQVLRAVGAESFAHVKTRVVGFSCFPLPEAVLLTNRGCAVACYADRPFIVHPSLDELLAMHGLGLQLPEAA